MPSDQQRPEAEYGQVNIEEAIKAVLAARKALRHAHLLQEGKWSEVLTGISSALHEKLQQLDQAQT